MNIPLAVRHGL